MEANRMEDRGTGALKQHMGNCSKLEMRQTRRGWCQECMGCEAQTEFKYFNDGQQVFHSLEEANFFCRWCCSACHPYKMVVKETNTEAEIITVDRPFKYCAHGCKCSFCPDCCFQTASFSSGNNQLGTMKEDCYICVPSFTVYDHQDKGMYRIHPPTCLGGICVNCCAEGNPCGKGCCKQSYRIFDPNQATTDGDAPYLGLIMKKPKSIATEVFTDAQAFIVDFPKDATPDQKGILAGTTLFINSIFYQGDQS